MKILPLTPGGGLWLPAALCRWCPTSCTSFCFLVRVVKIFFLSFVQLNLGTGSLLGMQNCLHRGDLRVTFPQMCVHLAIGQLGAPKPKPGQHPSPALTLASVEGCSSSFPLRCPKQAPGRCSPLQLFSLSHSLLLSASPTRIDEGKSLPAEQIQLPFITPLIYTFPF